MTLSLFNSFPLKKIYLFFENRLGQSTSPLVIYAGPLRKIRFKEDAPKTPCCSFEKITYAVLIKKIYFEKNLLLIRFHCLIIVSSIIITFRFFQQSFFSKRLLKSLKNCIVHTLNLYYLSFAKRFFKVYNPFYYLVYY